MILCHDKGVEGAAFMNWFLNFPVHSLILRSFTPLKGLISTIKRMNALNTGADGGLSLKRQKALEGFQKLSMDSPVPIF